jgi:uncharacterized membrane protein YebE (DUF533 family)
MVKRLLKSLIAGVLVGLVVGFLAALGALAFNGYQMWAWTHPQAGTGSAGIGAVSLGLPGQAMVAFALAGCVLGFYWQFRRD